MHSFRSVGRIVVGMKFSAKRNTYLIAEIVGRCEYHTSKLSASFSILTTEEISNEKQK